MEHGRLRLIGCCCGTRENSTKFLGVLTVDPPLATYCCISVTLSFLSQSGNFQDNRVFNVETNRADTKEAKTKPTETLIVFMYDSLL